MGLFNKLQFWKKEEEYAQAPDYDLGAQKFETQITDPLTQDPTMNEQAPDQTTPGQYPMATSYPASSPFPGRQSYPQSVPQEIPQEQPAVHPRDVELILAKLDAIKSEMDALHQRVKKIEQATEPQQRKYW